MKRPSFAPPGLAAAAVLCLLPRGLTGKEPPAGRAPAARGEVPHRPFVHTDRRPRIDGTLEAVWDRALLIDAFVQIEPEEGAAPSARTEVRVLYDEDALYVAFRCFDEEPGRIAATQMKRDGSLQADDRVSFVVGPFFDRRNGFRFEMNPAGARRDALVEDNNRVRFDWDGIWHGRASIDGTGWVAEMEIPFKTISFNPDTTRWSFNAERFIRRRNETIRWATPTRNSALESLADAGVLEGITGITQGLGLDVKPFAVSTIKRDHNRNRNGVDVDGGFDTFLKLSPSLTLALTVNTDFAQTEVDERRVNLTRFPLFFPEKRDFFLQDAGIFNFGGIFRNPLPFFSRRIGLDGRGQPVDILGGAKVTGRVGRLNLGVMDVQMKHTDELGNKNLFVGRASVNVLEQSTIGGIFTYGDPQSPEDNWVGGLDFNYRSSTYGGDKVVEGNVWVQRSTSSREHGNAGGFKLTYPNDRVNWRIGFTHIDRGFDAALGFVPRRGIREYFGTWRYRWRPDSTVIRSVDAGFNANLVTNLEDDVESRSLDLDVFAVETEFGDRLRVRVSSDREVLREDFEIAEGVVIPVGDYPFSRYQVRLESSQGRAVNVRLEYEGGEFFTGTRQDYQVELAWRFSPQFNAGFELQVNDVNLAEGDFITRIIRGRVNVLFTPDLSWSSFIQFDNVSDTIGVNSRVRWIIEPGNDLFLVLNQQIARDGDSLRVTETEFTAKLGWTYRF